MIYYLTDSVVQGVASLSPLSRVSQGMVKVVAGLWSHLEAQMGKSLFSRTLSLLTEFFPRIRADNILNKIYLCPKHKVGIFQNQHLNVAQR